MTAQAPTYLGVSASGDWTVARINRARLLDEHVVYPMREELLALSETAPRLAVDLGAVEYIGQAVIGTLVTLHRRAQLGGRRVALFRPQPAILEVFEICRLDRFFDLRRVAPGTPVPRLSPQEEAFVQAVREAPEEDAPRLVCADWLEDNGEPHRAELIRLQCGRAAGDPPSPRERDLLKAHAARWAGGLHGFASRWEYHRGFIEQVDLSGQALEDHAEDLVRLAPLRRVRVHGFTWLGELARVPAVSLLDELDLRLAIVDEDGLAALLSAPLPERVTFRLHGARVRSPDLRAELQARLGARLVIEG